MTGIELLLKVDETISYMSLSLSLPPSFPPSLPPSLAPLSPSLLCFHSIDLYKHLFQGILNYNVLSLSLPLPLLTLHTGHSQILQCPLHCPPVEVIMVLYWSLVSSIP